MDRNLFSVEERPNVTEFEDRFELVAEIGPFIEATRGLKGMVWDYTPTLRRLALRLYAPPHAEREDSYLVCVSIKRICSPIDWDDSQLEVCTGDASWDFPEGLTRLLDLKNGIEIDCGSVIGVVPKVKDWFFLWGIGRDEEGHRV